MRKLSVVIPAYNEEDGIERVIERVLSTRAAFAAQGWALQLIIVDDGSRDRTASRVAAYPDVQLVRHIQNRGYGAAIKTGFRHATGDYLAFLDADGTYPPESLPDLCRAVVTQEADMVVGSRRSGAKSEMPPTRRLGNFLYANLLSLIGNVVVRDTTSGMRVIRKQALSALYPLPDGLQFTPAMSTRAVHENLKTVEVPIPYAERVGRSKLSVVRDGLRFTNAIVWTALAYNPVRILGLASLALIGFALLLGLFLLVLRLSGVTTLDVGLVYAYFGVVVLSVAGITLFTLGAMFNYLTALFHKRPVRQGLFGRPIFNPPLDHHFGWVGLVGVAGGVLLSSLSFVLSLGGWEPARLWFYLLAAAMLMIVGMQLATAWLVMRVLEELSRREAAAQHDLQESEPENVAVGAPAALDASTQMRAN